MTVKLRHVGLQVPNLGRMVELCLKLGFKKVGGKEHLITQKMKDPKGQIIEFIQGKRQSHFCVHDYQDQDGNLLEVVNEKKQVVSDFGNFGGSLYRYRR